MISILAAVILDLLPLSSEFRLAQGSAGGCIALFGPTRFPATASRVPVTIAVTRGVRADSPVRFDEGRGGFAFWKRGAHFDTHKLVKFYSSVRCSSKSLNI